MRFFFYSLIALLAFYNTISAQDCSKTLTVNEIDKIKNTKTLKSAYLPYKKSMSTSYTFILELVNKKILLTSTCVPSGINDKNNEIGILLDNEESILIKFQSSSTSQNIMTQDIYFNSEEISYKQLETLSKNSIVEIKHYSENESFEIKPKRALAIKNAAQCLINNLDKETDLENTKIEETSKLELKKIERKNVDSKENENTSKVPSYYKPCNIIKDEVDEFEGFRKRVLGEVGIAKPSENAYPLFVTLTLIDDNLWMTARLDAIRYCVTTDSKINFKLQNGEIIRLPHEGKIDCGKGSAYYTRLTIEHQKQLKTSPISLIRLETGDGNIDIKYILVENYFSDNLDCFK